MSIRPSREGSPLPVIKARCNLRGSAEVRRRSFFKEPVKIDAAVWALALEGFFEQARGTGEIPASWTDAASVTFDHLLPSLL
jgi:hypothetical protein